MPTIHLDDGASRQILAAIRHEAEDAGLLRSATAPALARLAVALPSLVALLGVAWTSGNAFASMMAAALAGIACIQIGLVAHDAGHGAVSGNRLVNRVVGHLAFTLVNGLGFHSWCESHDAHHAFSQDESRDPDMQVDVFMSLTPRSAAQKSGLGRLLLPYQALYAWPIALLFAHSLRLQSLGRAFGSPRRHAVDVLCLPLHYAAWLILPSVVFGTAPALILTVYLVSTAVMGVYLALLFWVNHVGMPTLQAGHGRTVLEAQVVGTRNIRHARWFDFVFGGLDFQIEHHLLPRCPGSRLRALQSITRPHCIAAGLPYHEESPVEAVASITRHLRRIASDGSASSLREVADDPT